MRKIRLVLLALLLTACNLPLPATDQAVTPATDTPATVTMDYLQCGYNWATQPLPELSEQVRAAMDKAGLKGTTVRAEAYGENCLDSSNKVIGFTALETDYRVSMEVPDLEDTEALGNLVEKILGVLDQFPTRSTPGPQPGYLGIHFTYSIHELNLWFLITDAKAALGEGLHGKALLERLQQK